MSSLSRRSFARSAAVAGIALPFLRALGLDPFTERVAHAGPAATPRRVVWAYIPDGICDWNNDIGTPGATPTSFTLGQMLTPFAPHQQDTVILDGVDMNTPQVADTHTQGMALFLTAYGFQAPCGYIHGCDMSGDVLGVLNVSLDQYLAKKIGAATAFPSVQLGAQPNNGLSISFSGPGTGTAVPQNADPQNAFATLFANLGGSSNPALLTRLALRKSVLDNVTGDLAQLRTRLGMADRQKLDQQLAAVRAMELRLAPGSTPNICTKPQVASFANLNDAAAYPAIVQAHTAVLFNALACDLTRIATLQFRACYSNLDLPFSPLNSNSGIHTQSHAAFTSTAGHQTFVATKQWHYQQVADFATQLKNTPEVDGNGSMLDNTLIITGSDIGQGHTHKRLPWVTVGGKNMGVQTGRYLQFSGAPHTRMMVSVLNAMGVPDNSFGDPQYGTGPLPGFIA